MHNYSSTVFVTYASCEVTASHSYWNLNLIKPKNTSKELLYHNSHMVIPQVRDTVFADWINLLQWVLF